jgi:hypothetical protein
VKVPVGEVMDDVAAANADVAAAVSIVGEGADAGSGVGAWAVVGDGGVDVGGEEASAVEGVVVMQRQPRPPAATIAV